MVSNLFLLFKLENSVESNENIVKFQLHKGNTPQLLFNNDMLPICMGRPTDLILIHIKSIYQIFI